MDAKPDSRDFGMQVDMPALLRELEEIRRLISRNEIDGLFDAKFEISPFENADWRRRCGCDGAVRRS